MMTPQEALMNLYQATRALQANAETHEHLAKCANVLKNAIEKPDLDTKEE